MVKTNHLGALAATAGALVAVGFLILMMLVVEVRPAEATFPGKPKPKVGGGSGFNVTDNTTNERDPSYSPSSKRIAYSGHDGQDWEIYTINASGGGRLQITNNTMKDMDLAYSPSGKKIAFQGYDGQDKEIYTINAGGGGRLQVTNNTTK